MKKIIYTLFIVSSFALVFTSCNEEEVAPQTEIAGNGGGNGSVGKF